MSAPISWTRSFLPHWIVRFALSLLLFVSLTPVVHGEGDSSRKVLVLFNGNEGQTEWENMVYPACQTILNYYGMLPEYRDVNIGPLPDAETMSEYRGMITTFIAADLEDPAKALAWVNRQAKAGRKIIVLGRLAAPQEVKNDPDLEKLLKEIYQYLGLAYGGDFTASKALIRYATKDPKGVEFERKYPLLAETYEKFRPLRDDVNVYLSLKRTDRADSESAVIATSASGGIALAGYLYWEDRATFKKKWYLNPFTFFEEALGIAGMPRPDPTTLNGLRVAFSHIDADAFSGVSRIDGKSLCAEVIRDQIIKQYDFPITVSVIVGEIQAKPRGNPELVRLAREIFLLPNVEPGSHSYSHPYYWDPDYEYKERYDTIYGIPVPGYTYDAAMEIDYSVKYISEELSPPGKPCRVFQWSGNCLPRESDIARCDALGVLNINGGDTLFDDLNDSYSSVGPLYRKVGSRFQVHTGQANENLLTNLWRGPFYGFRDIITTMKRTGSPRRIAPIDIYYHFYSGEYPASLKAVKKVYEWVMDQDIAPIFTSEYISMVQGYLGTRVQKEGNGRYVIENYGRCLSLRFDAERRTPVLSQCKNVLGYTRDPQGLYISLIPGKEKAVIVLADIGSESDPGGPRPHLKRATGWVRDWRAGEGAVSFQYSGFGAGWVEIGGMEPLKPYDAKGSSLKGGKRRLKSDEKGVVTLDKITPGDLEISWQ